MASRGQDDRQNHTIACAEGRDTPWKRYPKEILFYVCSIYIITVIIDIMANLQ